MLRRPKACRDCQPAWHLGARSGEAHGQGTGSRQPGNGVGNGNVASNPSHIHRRSGPRSRCALARSPAVRSGVDRGPRCLRTLARESPGHRHAYAAVERVWAQAQVHAEDPRILALRQEAALRLTRRAARHRFTLSRALAAAAVLFVVGVIGISGWRFYDADAPLRSLAVAPVYLFDELRGIDHYRTAV